MPHSTTKTNREKARYIPIGNDGAFASKASDIFYCPCMDPATQYMTRNIYIAIPFHSCLLCTNPVASPTTTLHTPPWRCPLCTETLEREQAYSREASLRAERVMIPEFRSRSLLDPGNRMKQVMSETGRYDTVRNSSFIVNLHQRKRK